MGVGPGEKWEWAQGKSGSGPRGKAGVGPGEKREWAQGKSCISHLKEVLLTPMVTVIGREKHRETKANHPRTQKFRHAVSYGLPIHIFWGITAISHIW